MCRNSVGNRFANINSIELPSDEPRKGLWYTSEPSLIPQSTCSERRVPQILLSSDIHTDQANTTNIDSLADSKYVQRNSRAQACLQRSSDTWGEDDRLDDAASAAPSRYFDGGSCRVVVPAALRGAGDDRVSQMGERWASGPGRGLALRTLPGPASRLVVRVVGVRVVVLQLVVMVMHGVVVVTLCLDVLLLDVRRLLLMLLLGHVVLLLGHLQGLLRHIHRLRLSIQCLLGHLVRLLGHLVWLLGDFVWLLGALVRLGGPGFPFIGGNATAQDCIPLSDTMISSLS
ncbi:hypothetical protein FOCC_FOCC012698 [Frankliniella occidentalis]|nr:hypothetical protein FOCC_FOCC012698 [Frankliniella occidentalis]